MYRLILLIIIFTGIPLELSCNRNEIEEQREEEIDDKHFDDTNQGKRLPHSDELEYERDVLGDELDFPE